MCTITSATSKYNKLNSSTCGVALTKYTIVDWFSGYCFVISINTNDINQINWIFFLLGILWCFSQVQSGGCWRTFSSINEPFIKQTNFTHSCSMGNRILVHCPIGGSGVCYLHGAFHQMLCSSHPVLKP